MERSNTKNKLFEGIRIVDFSNVVSGPMATQILADQGADVIKIESPENGDLTRMIGANRNGFSSMFAVLNRNKRSMVINIKSPKGQAVLNRLLLTADVLVQNFRPGVMDKLGLGKTAVRKNFPSLIYMSISGFGEVGPYSKRRVYDPVIQAISGYASTQNPSHPDLIKNLICDKVTALTAAQAISGALFARERDKNRDGEFVDLSMLDAGLAFLWPDGMMNNTLLGDAITPMPPLSDIYQINETADGHITYLVVSDSEWVGLCQALEIPKMSNDSRFVDLINRIKNIDELKSILKKEMVKWNTVEICDRLEEEDVPFAKINSVSEVMTDPQILANSSIDRHKHPIAGDLQFPKHPASFEKRSSDVRLHAPSLGEHTRDILLELELENSEIENLYEDGSVA
ncbi:MAG: CoA transferase [Pseudomonadota bacterium]|nr:CoA transferase [Pseudomonadota bacterium]